MNVFRTIAPPECPQAGDWTAESPARVIRQAVSVLGAGMFLLIAGMGILHGTPASGDEIDWNASSGSWFDAADWNDTTLATSQSPGPNDTANIANSGSAAITSSTAAALYLYVSEGSSLSLSGGSLTVYGEPETIGYSGSGTMIETGGTNTSIGEEVVGGGGFDGVGIFEQAKGANNAENVLSIGQVEGSIGVYDLKAGILDIGSEERVGESGTGNFVQTGGTNTSLSGGGLIIGAYSGSHGTYQMSAGTLKLPYVTVAAEGNAAFTQTGGMALTNNLDICESGGISGEYDLSGTGSLLVNGYEYIGYSGSGTFVQTGGTKTVTIGGIFLGANGGTGSYYLDGGSVNANAVTIDDGGVFAVEASAPTVSSSLGDLANVGVFSVSGNSVTGTGLASAMPLAAIYIQTLPGIFETELSGTGSGEYGQLIAGQAQIGGDLVIDASNGLESQITGNDTFTIFAASSLSGTFDNVSNGARLDASNGLASFIVNYGPGSPYGANAVVLSNFQPVNMILSEVGNPGNAPDPATGSLYGAVNNTYAIGTYDVTVVQYAAFLNAVAQADPYELYNAGMASIGNLGGGFNTGSGIERSGSPGQYKYTVTGGAESDPITYVSWLDAARFCNWMQNGQPNQGGEGPGSTESGAYTLNGDQTSGLETRNANATWWIPSRSEWYKAAYYDPRLNGGGGGYWTYATQSNSTPGNLVSSLKDEANYDVNGILSVTQSKFYNAMLDYLTPVGAFTGAESYYGTYDQTGDVWQWDDQILNASARGTRGGFWGSPLAEIEPTFPEAGSNPLTESYSTGFRVAASTAQNRFVVTPIAGPNGTINPGTPEIVNGESNVTFTAEAASGYVVNQWLVNGSPAQSGGEGFTLESVISDATVEVTFAVPSAGGGIPVITSTGTVFGYQGKAFSFQVAATHNPKTYEAPNLPQGLGINASTGLLSGTAITPGTYHLRLEAINGSGEGSGTCTLIIRESKPIITSAQTAYGKQGTGFTYLITAKNNPTVYEAPGLPTGLILVAKTGLIRGTPRKSGTYSIDLKAFNLAGDGDEMLTLVVRESIPVLTSAKYINGVEGEALSYQTVASNNPLVFDAPNLPEGLIIGATTGLISGMPKKPGIYGVQISAFNAAGKGSENVIFTIREGAPVITSGTTATGTVGNAFSYQVTATNKPLVYDAPGLPAGLSINAHTGLLSGTPVKAGTFEITINAFNDTGKGSVLLTLTVGN